MKFQIWFFVKSARLLAVKVDTNSRFYHPGYISRYHFLLDVHVYCYILLVPTINSLLGCFLRPTVTELLRIGPWRQAAAFRLPQFALALVS